MGQKEDDDDDDGDYSWFQYMHGTMRNNSNGKDGEENL